MKENISSHNTLKWPAAWISKLLLTYVVFIWTSGIPGQVEWTFPRLDMKFGPFLLNSKTDNVFCFVLFLFSAVPRKPRYIIQGHLDYDPPEKFIQPQRSLLIILLFSTSSFLTDAILIHENHFKSLSRGVFLKHSLSPPVLSPYQAGYSES